MRTPGKKTFRDRLRSLNWRTPARWAAAGLAAYLHALLLNIVPYTPDTISWLFPLLLVAPGVIVMVALRNGFRRWYRWAAVCLLFTTTFPDSATAVLVIGEAWALHRQFVTERDGALFRFPRKRPEVRPADSAAAAGTFGRPRKHKPA